MGGITEYTSEYEVLVLAAFTYFMKFFFCINSGLLERGSGTRLTLKHWLTFFILFLKISVLAYQGLTIAHTDSKH